MYTSFIALKFTIKSNMEIFYISFINLEGIILLLSNNLIIENWKNNKGEF